MAVPASKNAMQVAYSLESTRAVIPADGLVGRILQIKEGSRASLTRTFERSNTLRADRQGGKQIGGTRYGVATVVCPMSGDLGVCEMIRAALGGAAFTATSTEIASHSFTHAANNRPTYTLEFLYDVGVSGDPLVERLVGAEINRMTLNQTQAGGTLTFEFIGQDLIPEGAAGFGDTTPTWTAASNFNEMAGTAIGAELSTSMTEGSNLIQGFTNFSLTVNNNVEPLFAMGRPDAYYVGRGDFDIEANFDVYLEDFAILNKYINGTRELLRLKLVEDGTSGAVAAQWVLRRGVYTQNEKAEQGPVITQRCRVFGEVNSSAPTTKASFYIKGMST